MNPINFLKKPLYFEKNVDANLAFLTMTIHGFTTKLYNTEIPSYHSCIAYHRNNSIDWLSSIEDQDRIGKYVVSQFMSDPSVITGLHTRWLKNYKLMMEKYNSYFNFDFSSLSSSKLASWQTSFLDFYKDKVSMPGFIDGYMFYAERRLLSLLEKFFKENKDVDYYSILSILTNPIEESFINREERELRDIIIQMQEQGFSKEDDPMDWLGKNSKFYQLINNHLKKYSWIKSSYIGYKEYSFLDLSKEIKDLMTSSRSNEDEFLSIKAKKDKLMKKYKFNEEIIAITRLTEIIVKWQDERKEYTLTFTSIYDKFLKDIERRFSIRRDLLVHSMPDDISELLSGLSLKEGIIDRLKKRSIRMINLITKGRVVECITDNEEIDYFVNDIYKVATKTNEFKGTPACLGNVRGKVRIILSSHDNDKIKAGEILVTSMTRPEHLPAMKKALAIITDDGGITCHAAIVSRELKVPCIIGTKVATEILKDGDEVEVNANNGVVTILEKS